MKKEVLKDNYLLNVILTTLITFILELVFKLISGYSIFEYSLLRIFLSCSFLSIIISFISQLFKNRLTKNIINGLYIFIYSIYSLAQLGFLNFLGVYISFNTSSQFGAVTGYIKEFIESFSFKFYLILIPFIIYILLLIFISKKTKYERKIVSKKSLRLLILLLIVSICYYGTIRLPFMQNKYQIKSNSKLFKNPNISTLAVHEFGVSVFAIIDFKSFILPVQDDIVVSTDNEEEIVAPIDYQRKVTNYLEQINEGETNNKYKSLNEYFLSQTITPKNDYTGIFEGKNLVYILIESGSNALLKEEYFPNFNYLYKNGWSWENSYSPRNSCATGNNEFSALTSLYSIYNTCTSNVYKKNTYFESIFNIFNEKGYITNSMHDFVNWYYDRTTIHKNMYSGAFYGATQLKIKTADYYGEWPSDIEFMEKAFDIILNEKADKPFMTFLTTVTGHTPYTASSTYGDLHMDYYVNEGYSKATSRYLSKMQVTDEALGVMIEKLKDAGEFDNTVFVLFADHYPYALAQKNVKEFVDYELEDNSIERTPFLIYSSGITPEVHKEYTSYLNIIPTIANLFNLDYDPRLYMGNDLLSETYESMVVFADGSWKNEKAFYDASKSKIKYYGEEEYTPEEIQSINESISSKMTISTNAIKNNYFSYLENKMKDNNLSIYEKQELPVEEPLDN